MHGLESSTDLHICFHTHQEREYQANGGLDLCRLSRGCSLACAFIASAAFYRKANSNTLLGWPILVVDRGRTRIVSVNMRVSFRLSEHLAFIDGGGLCSGRPGEIDDNYSRPLAINMSYRFHRSICFPNKLKRSCLRSCLRSLGNILSSAYHELLWFYLFVPIAYACRQALTAS